MKKLIIAKGASGAGKTTFANFLVDNLSVRAAYFEADMWMVDGYGAYMFSPDMLGYCHGKCLNAVQSAMANQAPVVIVSNTSTKANDVKPYLDLAQEYGYEVTSLCLENMHGNKSIHNVPEETLRRQESNLRNSLRLR